MKKLYLIIVSLVTGFISLGQSQPNNLDIGLLPNGSNGSNSGSGAYLEVALRPVSGTYTSTPLAEDFGIIFKAPKTDFDITDQLQIVQVNTSLFGGAATTTAIDVQVVIDASPDDPDNLYYSVALNTSQVAGLNLSSLTVGNWSFAFTFKFSNLKTPVQYNKIRVVDQLNNAPLSAFLGSTVFSYLNVSSTNQLTPSSFFILPVSLLNFSAYKNGSKNSLLWTTASESNNRGFEVLRSTDGTNYSSIGFVNSLATAGTSSTNISYSFDDNSVAGKKQYYRLKQTDLDNRSKLSNIVLINGAKPLTLAIAGVFPNPANAEVNVIIDAPGRDNVTLVVSDIYGKTVKQKAANVETGSNTIPVDISALAKGSYLVKVLCKSSDCETAVSKFVKQ